MARVYRLAGICTVGDADMLRWVAGGAAMGLRFEPSATAGFAGPHHLTTSAAGTAFLAAVATLSDAFDLPKEIVHD
jgi:D-serine dehydratase